MPLRRSPGWPRDVTALDDITRPTLVVDCKSIVGQYRVYLLMIPKAHLMIASDAAAVIGQKLTDVATKLQTDIDRAKSAGKDTADAQQDLNNLKAAISAGTGASAPVDGILNFTLPLSPSEYAADQQNVRRPGRTWPRPTPTSCRPAKTPSRSWRTSRR